MNADDAFKVWATRVNDTYWHTLSRIQIVPLAKNGIGTPVRYTFSAVPNGDSCTGPVSYEHSHLLDKDQSEDMLMKMNKQRYFQLLTLRICAHI